MEKLKSVKSDVILSTLSPLDPRVQRYLSLVDKIEKLLDGASDPDDACVSIDLIAECMMLQEELYQLSVDKHRTEAN